MARDYRDYRDYHYGMGDYRDSRRDYRMEPRQYSYGPNFSYGNYPTDMNSDMSYGRGMDHDMMDQRGRRDYADYRDYRDYNDYGREYRGYYGETPFGIMESRSYPMDYNYDYASGYSMRREDTEKWTMKLMKHIDEKDKEMLSKDKIMRKAEELGVKFEEFKPEEFYITVLMMYTDYCKVLGNANIDIYVRLAKAWLNDEDAAKQNSEKLTAYYKHIVNGR